MSGRVVTAGQDAGPQVGAAWAPGTPIARAVANYEAEQRRNEIAGRRVLRCIVTLAVALWVLVIVSMMGCTARYEAENGPRGPERVEFGPPWSTEANPCDTGCAPR